MDEDTADMADNGRRDSAQYRQRESLAGVRHLSHRVAQKVTEEVLLRWTGRLAGADGFTGSHAWEIVERLRIDG